MKKRLIRLLGGWTPVEFEKHSSVLSSLSSMKDVEIATLRNQIDELRREKELYREKLFNAYSINTPSETSPPITQNTPISRGAESWSARRSRLERADVLRASAKKQVDQTEKHYLEKNANAGKES